MAGLSVKRRVTSSTNPLQDSTRPHKRLRTSSGSGSNSEVQDLGIGGILRRVTSWAMGGWSRPSRGAPQASNNAVMRSRAFGATTGSRVIDVTGLDDDEDDEESMRKQARRTQAREARSHLNDHVQQLPETPNIHPSLPAPLFQSSFDTPQRAGPSQVAAPSTGSSTPRPDVAVKRRERSYAWARPASPSSSSSCSSRSSSSSAHGRLPPRRSRSNLRGDTTPKGQLKKLQQQQIVLGQLIAKGEASGDPAVHAYRRVYEENERGLEEAERRRSLASRKHQDLQQEKLQLTFDNLRLDRRETLDEALTPSRQQIQIPRPAINRRLPVPVERHDSFLRNKLNLEKERLEKQLRARFQPSIPRDVTSAQAAVIDARLRDPSFEATKGSAMCNAESLRRLKAPNWLNDEVVNFYAELINSRAKAAGKPVHCMNSYFYQKLSEEGYERANLKRWTKRMKIDIFTLDKLLVPINLDNMHWVCAVVNLKRKRFEYYDSMSSSRKYAEAFKHLRGYLKSEHKEKKGSDFDLTGWEDHFSDNTPKQDNVSDCGVFSCQTLEAAARGRDLPSGFEFTAKNMPFFRRLMIVEIASGELASRSWS